MTRRSSRLKAISTLNYDLFSHHAQSVPAPATMYALIREESRKTPLVALTTSSFDSDQLPTVAELYRLFDEFNLMYFQGHLPRVRIAYSERMASAGSYTPDLKLIKIGRKYHKLFPEDLNDTLKHEMIHIIHLHHGAAFKAEAARIGATLKARSHPELRKTPKYLYTCPSCGKEYPRQKRLRMASCGPCSRGHFEERFKLRLVRR